MTIRVHPQTIRRILVPALTFAALAWSLTPAHADGGRYGCDREGFDDYEFFEPGNRGVGKLCVLPRGATGHMLLTGLVPGNAYTVWWAYVDDPSQCTGGTPLPEDLSPATGCDIFDFGAPPGGKPLGMFGRMASGIAPRNGRLLLHGSWGGMQPSSGAEVWFWVFGHGPANLSDGAALARQLLTPEDPQAGAPHLGNDVDGPRGYPAALAVFKID